MFLKNKDQLRVMSPSKWFLVNDFGQLLLKMLS